MSESSLDLTLAFEVFYGVSSLYAYNIIPAVFHYVLSSVIMVGDGATDMEACPPAVS